MQKRYSLFDKLPLNEPIAFRKGEFIERQLFLAHVFSIAKQLPEHKYAINLCEDRYIFLVAFMACMLKMQTSLLPQNRSKNEIEQLKAGYTDSYVITDKHSGNVHSNHFIAELEVAEVLDRPAIEIDCELIAAIVFTSGSTGHPKPNPKRWKNLVSSAKKVKDQLNLSFSGQGSIVATVPPQHMFGFEMSIVYPLVNGVCVHCDKPFFPHDIKKALKEITKPRILITTPLHLRACSESNIDWPVLDSIVSATAPLPEEIATLAEKRMRVDVQEIYGCSEVGAIATRHTTRESHWQLLEGYQLIKRMKRYWLQVPGFEQEIELPDRYAIDSKSHFTLVGRDSDLINIGGKRGSLEDLTFKLKGLEGVKDGIFFVPNQDGESRIRLAALVIAPGVKEEDIIAQLADSIDQVFLPRPIIKVDRLPYNETGKLPKKALLAILDRFRGTQPLLETA